MMSLFTPWKLNQSASFFGMAKEKATVRVHNFNVDDDTKALVAWRNGTKVK